MAAGLTAGDLDLLIDDRLDPNYHRRCAPACRPAEPKMLTVRTPYAQVDHQQGP
jgi:hypothetical protein